MIAKDYSSWRLGDDVAGSSVGHRNQMFPDVVKADGVAHGDSVPFGKYLT
jgi:hypothetical protein